MEPITFTAIITGVIEVAKQAFNLPTRFIPLLSVGLGIGLALSQAVTVENIIVGIVIGLSACGLYDVAKTSILGK